MRQGLRLVRGNWVNESSHYDSEDMPALFADDGSLVCWFGNATEYYPTEGTPPNEANAHLIAAAPELYEVLSEAMERGGVIQMCLYGKALAALAKACGETL